LWVDSRYWSQAEKELAPTGIQMMKIASAAAALHIEWLANNLTSGHRRCRRLRTGLATARALTSGSAIRLILKTDTDVTDLIWHDRASLPTAAVYNTKHHLPSSAVR
jgi:Xaa-Pro aminopeptidase